MKKLKVIALSDTHCMMDRIKVPDGDMLLHAGDLTFRGTVAEISKELEIISALPHKYKVIVMGNHDWLGERDPALARQMCKDKNIIWLQDELINIEGINIYGSAFQPEFCGWAFNVPRAELNEVWARIPDKVDILITHGPPYGVLDTTPSGEKVGCWDLMDAINRVRPQFHIFGHIHGGYGREKGFYGTEYINASICTEAYKPSNLPIEFQIEVKDETK